MERSPPAKKHLSFLTLVDSGGSNPTPNAYRSNAEPPRKFIATPTIIFALNYIYINFHNTPDEPLKVSGSPLGHMTSRRYNFNLPILCIADKTCACLVLVLVVRVELTTNRVSDGHSTTELHQYMRGPAQSVRNERESSFFIL